MTPPTLADVLARIAAYVPQAVVSRAAFADVCAVARRFPATQARCIHMETRLRRGDDRVDVVFSFKQGAGAGWDACLPTAAFDTPYWQRVRDYDRACAAPGLLQTAVKSSWLEFDVDGPPPEVPVPGLFVGLKKTGPGSPEGLSAPDRLIWQTRVTEAAMAQALGEPLPDRVVAQLRRVYAALPQAAKLTYVGVMLQRGRPSIRLCLTDLAQHEIFPYLRRVGWPGPLADYEALAAGLSGDEGIGLRGRMGAEMLHLDVWEDVRPRAGLEFIFARKPQILGTLAEIDWLDRLVALGLCDAEKKAALGTWPAYRMGPFVTPGEVTPALRYVNHVKLVSEPTGFVAKAYLTFEVGCWFTPRHAVGRLARALGPTS